MSRQKESLMMNSFEICTVAISTVTMVFVGISMICYAKQAHAAARQTELLKDSLARSTYAAFEGTVFELSKVLIANSGVRPFFYEASAMPCKGHPMYDQIMACAILYLDFFDHALTVEQQSPGGTTWDGNNWRHWIKDMFLKSPTLRKTALAERDWYNVELGNMAEDAEQKVLRKTED